MNEDEHGITPADVTGMTVEELGDLSASLTVERGNGDSIQTMELTTMECQILAGLLETFMLGLSPSVSMEFKSLPVRRVKP